MCTLTIIRGAGLALVIALTIVFAGGPSGVDAQQAEPTTQEQAGTMPGNPEVREPEATAEELAQLVAGNGQFAFDLFNLLKSQREGNLFFSPYSISEALAMTYAGARAETAAQMALVMHFTLDEARLHPAFLAQRDYFAGLAQIQNDYERGDRFRLNVADSVWVEQTYTLRSEFAEILSRYYGVQPQPVDFQSAYEQARQTINAWVSERTEGRIANLIPEGILDALTRLVLVNAIYFNASWMQPFEPGSTRDQPFHLLDGSEVNVPMMRQTANFDLAQGDGFRAISLPYLGQQLSMLVVMPDEGRFVEFQDGLSQERLDEVLSAMCWSEVEFSFPKFRIESDFSLASTLVSLGMPLAFNALAADFTGMAEIPAEDQNLYIGAVIHKAFVAVEETGTEAAAATAVIMEATGAVMTAPRVPIRFVVDQPYFVFIRDNPSGAILFMGRVVDPR